MSREHAAKRLLVPFLSSYPMAVSRTFKSVNHPSEVKRQLLCRGLERILRIFVHAPVCVQNVHVLVHRVPYYCCYDISFVQAGSFLEFYACV